MKKEIGDAIAAHSAWKQRLRDAVDKGTSEFKVETVKTDNQCAFGKWFYSLPASEQTAHSNIKDLHAQFHASASKVLNLAVTGKKAEAEKEMAIGGEFAKVSGQLVTALMKWSNDAKD